MTDRKLVLEDGSVFEGTAFGGSGTRVCEVVFNTSMICYQEIISDASCAGQAVVMTYPLIGNYGVAEDDLESKTPSIGGLIVREYNNYPSNFRYTKTLAEILEENDIPGIAGIDTRMLALHLRECGAMRGAITDADTPDEQALQLIKDTPVRHDLVKSVSCKKKWYSRTSSHIYNVLVIDCGIMLGLVKNLNQRGANVTVLPCDTDAQTVRALNPDGIIISNGPGSPEDAPFVTELIKQLTGEYPILGIGLGHELIALAAGAGVYKMKCGHHGDNNPVRNLITGRIETANQNHGYAVDESTLAGTGFTVTHKNVLDGTVEGIMCEEKRIFGLQYYYELTAAPSYGSYSIDRFLSELKKDEQGTAGESPAELGGEYNA